MTKKSDALPTEAFAARCHRVSRAIHWLTVALVSGLLVTALFGHIDPHGHGNDAFLWHSSMGIAVYLLSISRVLLWLVYRPTVGRAETTETGGGANRGLRAAFYALLVALPISGWWLASEEGMPANLFGIPALPQWYYRETVTQSTAVQSADSRGAVRQEDPVVEYLSRLHAGLAAALSVVILLHIAVVIRSRVRRGDGHDLESRVGRRR
jgi:cytochrome b561